MNIFKRDFLFKGNLTFWRIFSKGKKLDFLLFNKNICFSFTKKTEININNPSKEQQPKNKITNKNKNFNFSDEEEENFYFPKKEKNLKTNLTPNEQNKLEEDKNKQKSEKENQIKRSEIRKIIKEESGIEKKRVRGSGPGGQHQNKTSSAIFLKDEKTNISIKVTNSRDSIVNEGIAKKRLLDKLDVFYNGKDSKLEKEKEKIKKQKAKSAKRSLQKHSNKKEN